MKTAKAYYKDGKFWHLPGDGWPTEPNFSRGYYPDIEQKALLSIYQQSLTSALKEAVEFEDQEAIWDLVYLEYNQTIPWPTAKPNLDEGLYSFPEQEVEIVYQYWAYTNHWHDFDKHSFECMNDSKNSRVVSRLVPKEIIMEEKTVPHTEEDKDDWTLSRKRMPDFDGSYYVYGFMHHSCGNVVPFYKVVECRNNQWVKSDVGEQMTYWRKNLPPPVIEDEEDKIQ